MADPRAPTRADLAKFLPDQRTIRAFEKLFELVPDDIYAVLEQALIEAGSAAAKAVQVEDGLAAVSDTIDYLAQAPEYGRQALEAFERIADAVELLAAAPADTTETKVVVDYVDYDTNITSVVEKNGRVWWNNVENCLNVALRDGVVLQVGFEQYLRGENSTGAQINNGEIVGFAGVNGEIKISKYIADGSITSLYFIGVATHDMPNGDVGPVTTYGKVRDLDTSSWTKGTILYASPTTAGALTSTRPTAPNEVIVVAAVLVQDAANGVILVRPSIPPAYDYASYSSTVDQTLAAINTSYPVTFNTTEVEHGITLVSNSRVTAGQAGLYRVAISLQATSSNASSSTVYAALSKNGTAIARTGLALTIKANGDTKLLVTSFQVSLQAGDYIEIIWGSSTTSMRLDYIAAPWVGFPDIPSALIEVSQIQF